MMCMYVRKKDGITLIALVITIIVLMLLVGVTINMVINGGILEKSQKASQEYKKAQIKEELEQEIVVFQAQTYQEQNRSATLSELEAYFKIKGYPTLMQNGLQVEYKEYIAKINEKLEITQIEKKILNIEKTNAYYEIVKVDGDNLQLKITIENANGLESIEYPDVPENNITFSDNRTIYTTDIVLKEAEEYEVKIKAVGQSEEIFQIIPTQKPIISIKYENDIKIAIIDYLENDKFEHYYSVDEGNTWQIYNEEIQLQKTTNTIMAKSVLKQGNEIVNKNVKIAREEIEESKVSSTLKANGVIDIVWLDTENNVIDKPISPANYLCGLTAIKYNETTKKEENVNDPANDTSWYNYVAQTGTNDGKTSIWANARTKNSDAYFVWIPRYAYKITYFDTKTHADEYRKDNTKTEGIIGYSNKEGIIVVDNEIKKLLIGSEPTNVIGTVKTEGYTDYIVHPAFEFEGDTKNVNSSRAGIWVGKFESSGTASSAINEGEVKIVPNATPLGDVTVGEIFTACEKIKTKYGLTVDSHMMKNTEWGAVAYLTESKYGRNGEEVSSNNSSLTTGGGTNDIYKTENVEQSTTGNIYGVYDMNGTSWDYVAGMLDSSLSNGTVYDFTKINAKYYNVYTNYNESKKIKGDGVYETSTAGTGTKSWHIDYSEFINSSRCVFVRGRTLW